MNCGYGAKACEHVLRHSDGQPVTDDAGQPIKVRYMATGADFSICGERTERDGRRERARRRRGIGAARADDRPRRRELRVGELDRDRRAAEPRHGYEDDGIVARGVELEGRARRAEAGRRTRGACEAPVDADRAIGEIGRVGVRLEARLVDDARLRRRTVGDARGEDRRDPEEGRHDPRSRAGAPFR